MPCEPLEQPASPPETSSGNANRKQIRAFSDPRCALPAACCCQPRVFLSSPPNPLISSICRRWMEGPSGGLYVGGKF